MMDAQMHTSHDQGLSTSFLQTVLKETSRNFDIGSLFLLSFFFFFWREIGVVLIGHEETTTRRSEIFLISDDNEENIYSSC